MKFMTVAFSLSGKFWQFGAGLKTGRTRFKQTSALLRKLFTSILPPFPFIFLKGGVKFVTSAIQDCLPVNKSLSPQCLRASVGNSRRLI